MDFLHTAIQRGKFITSGGESWLVLGPITEGGFASIWKVTPFRSVVAMSRPHLEGAIPDHDGISECPDMLLDLLEELAANEPVYALKALDLKPTDSHYIEMVDRLMQEAKLLGTLYTPQIPRFCGIARREPIPFFIMEFIRGKTLANFFNDEFVSRDQPIPLHMIGTTIMSSLTVVGCLHERGIIHRDVKPENFMCALTDDKRALLKLIDLGIAKVTSRAAPVRTTRRSRALTTVGSPIMVTPNACAPEQLDPPARQDIRPTTDIYLLGLLFYWLLSGGQSFLPLTGNLMAVRVAMEKPLPRFRHPELGPKATDELHNLISHMLALKHEERPESTQAVRTRFEHIRETQRHEARSVTSML